MAYMQLKYGSYSFNAGGVKLRVETERRKNGYGAIISNILKIHVDGYLQADGETANSTAIIALYAAMQTPYQDLILYQSDGAESATYLKNVGSVTGVRITDGPNFPDSTGFEYNQGRRFNFTAEAEYPYAGSNLTLLRYREEVEFHGGGPLFMCRASKNGLPQKQKIYDFTPFVAVQSGEAWGYLDYPPDPLPIWPAALKMAPVIRKVGGTRVGPSGYIEFGKTWQIVHESPTALIGLPRLWVG